MTSKSLQLRLVKIENSRRVVLVPLVIIYQAKAGISESQQQMINIAKAQNRAVKLIRMVVVGADGQRVPASKASTDY
ncbi:MAG: hypothetical protein ACXW0Q_07130 [Methylovulum sp.]